MEELLTFNDGVYRTADRKISWFARIFPSVTFYCKFARIVYKAGWQAKRGLYDYETWSHSAHDVLKALESVGVVAEYHGVHHVRNLKSPCVFISNHMSTFETTCLPVAIQPLRNMTCVIKDSLLEYPVFKHVMRSRDPIAVSRENPREDFKAVIAGGIERLNKGVSIVVFPQTTRSTEFDPEQFNSIGIKLAQKAKVPVVPVALITDAWSNGTWLKDLGRIYPDRTARFAFGEPIEIEGRGAEQHRKVIEFIQRQLAEWRAAE